MNYIKQIKAILLVGIISGLFTTSTLYKVNAQNTSATKPAVQQLQTTQEMYVKPLAVVNSPSTYLNKTIVMEAKFDKFSTLGLDYKPALKSSEEYISFLIKREDTSFDIPLSELKLFLKRSVAEKFIDLKTNDKIEIKGNVFSDALGDAWVDVKEIKILEKAPAEKK